VREGQDDDDVIVSRVVAMAAVAKIAGKLINPTT
jgi:hypothetical protein